MGKNIFVFLILLLLSCSLIAQEGIPKQKELVKFGNLTIQKSSSKNASIKFETQALESFNGNYSILNKKASSKSTKSISLSKGQKSSQTVIVDNIQDNELKMVSVNIEIPNAPLGYKKNYYKHFYIKKEKNNYKVIDPKVKDPSSIKKTELIYGKTSSSRSTQNYSVNISGKITIDGISKGLYGNQVSLVFRNSSSPAYWYHPNVGVQQNVTYDVLDSQGNFDFTFTFTGNLSNYNQAVVFVNTANDAAYLATPSNGYEVTGSNGTTSYFNEAEGVVIPLNGSTTINATQNGVVNRSSGEILRHMMLARELSIQRYNGNCPYNIPPIAAYENNLSVAGRFVIAWDPANSYYHYIEIDPQYTDFSTVSHEYGHYINFLMWGREKYSAATTEIKEGWAIFYSFASKNYGNKVYNDSFDNYDDNTETAPFYYGTTRYDNIRYAYSTNNKPEYAAIACYLWNAYDGYEGNNFEHNYYNVGDNDDISGQSSLLFEVFRQLPNSVIAWNQLDRNALHNFFYNSVGQNYKSSSNDLYNFLFDDLYNIPSHKMRSTQTKNFNGNTVNSGRKDFTWDSQSYSSSYFQNKESGYKLYYKSGGLGN